MLFVFPDNKRDRSKLAPGSKQALLSLRTRALTRVADKNSVSHHYDIDADQKRIKLISAPELGSVWVILEISSMLMYAK